MASNKLNTMPDDTFRASVDMHNNGLKTCSNQPVDVATIVKLLNLSDVAEGGRNINLLPPFASPGGIYRAILNFEQLHNNLGQNPRLSVDVHVEQNGMTLVRLNRTARKIGVFDPHAGPSFPPDIPIPPGPAY